MRCARFAFLIVLCSLFAFSAPPELPQSPTIPTVDLTLSAPTEPGDLVTTLNIVVVLTLLVLAPSLILMATSFARILIVFSFLRTAMGTQQSPPTQLLVSFALILTMFIMEPVAKEGYEKGIKPYIAKEIPYDEAFLRTAKPFKDFMIRNTRPKDLALFYRIRGLENPQTINDVPLTIVLPAFIISEMKTAFQIGFLLYLPFLVIDMVISSILMAMGMMMLPPTMISLPFKILIFVLVDGFNLLTLNLVSSFK
ncbi:flagellar type III secretion system pore protein FliP [Helicobacter burdigaliensis]|uniref:flagellar type III secretion system pore protein FliP n=1 Tax=Helicobacter burdigaliensis TaxID=2315334 RepID=UPI000EF71634|nr:flagellar type III secretion system pore protein FliP [Helicobacter burdigaliensis]